MHELESQVAVVGQEEQSLAGLIQPADRVDALRNMRHQVEYQGPMGGIAVGTEIATGLVDEPVHGPLAADGLAIDRDVLGGRIDLGAELADHAAVHRHPTGLD